MASIRKKIVIKNGQQIVEEIHKVVVHKFSVGDVDDPDIYAAGPLYDWERSESGKFIMKHAVDKPVWTRYVDYNNYGHQYAIVAELEMKKLSEYYLRWGNENGI